MKRDTFAAALAAVALAACATPAPAPAPVAVAPAWSSPLPHGGTVAELNRWWTQFDDPLLARLVAAAEGVSPSIASAGARLAEARATRVGATAALLPSLDASANVGRGRPDVSLPLGTTESAALQASWELDVFGRNRAARDAAGARRRAPTPPGTTRASSSPPKPRTSMSACAPARRCLAQARLDADSRAETARLTGSACKAASSRAATPP